MIELKRIVQQGFLAITAATIGVFALLPALLSGSASAAQLSPRSMTMSTSALGATAASYSFSVTANSSYTIKGIAVDMCADSPLVDSATCTSTGTIVGLNLGTAVTTSGTLGVSGWTGGTLFSGTGFSMTDAAGVAVSSGNALTFTLTNVTNPTTTAGTFYARVTTWTTTAGATGYTHGAAGYSDYGGLALSTAANISITAKVFETLTFCVFNSSCGTAPSLVLGDPTTGALSTTSAYATNETGSNSAQYTVATNAGGGVGVAMRGTTLCRSATPANCNTGTASAFTISSMNTVYSAAHALATGVEQFGMCADTTGATGGLAAQTPYVDTANSCHGQTTTSNVYAGTSLFGFNDATSAGGTNNASGSTVLQSTGAVSSYTGSFMFLADVANTTEAGLYTTSLNMVATSTF